MAEKIKEPDDGWPTEDAPVFDRKLIEVDKALQQGEAAKTATLEERKRTKAEIDRITNQLRASGIKVPGMTDTDTTTSERIDEPDDDWPTDDQEERDAAPQVDTQAAIAEPEDLSVEEDLKLRPPFVYPENRKAAVATPTKKVAPAPSPAVQQTAAVLSKKEPPTIEPEQPKRTVRSRMPARVLASRQEPYKPAATLEGAQKFAEGAWATAEDIAQGGWSGAVIGLRNQLRDADRGARWLEENVADFGGIWFDKDGVHILSSQELRDKGGPLELKTIIPKPDDPEGTAGFVTQGIAQFLAGFAGGGRIIKGIGGLSKKGRAAELMARSAISDATVWDDHQERLGNLIQSFDVLGEVSVLGYKTDIHKQFVDYMAAHPDDDIATDKFKSAMEGVVMGALLSPFLRSARAIKKARAAKEAARIEKLRATPRAGSARIAMSLKAAEASDLADEVAAQNQDIAQQLIRDFQVEQRRPGWKPGDADVTISKLNEETGLLEIDYEAVRKLGRERSEELFKAQREAEIVEQFKGQPEQAAKVKAAMEQTEEALAAGRWDEAIDKWTSPLLNPEKFNHIIAIASDLKNNIPKGSNVPWDDNKTVIDNLFDLTQQRHFTEEGTKNIADTLSKYNFSFDDYVLTIVGTGSEAGKVLSKLSQLKRSIKQTESVGQKKEREARDSLDGALENAWKRLENIRRGGLVTQIATAARNFESVFIRSPAEALNSIMETALYKLEHKEFRGMVKPSEYRGALRPLEHILGDPVAARDWVQLILSQKQLEPVHKQLFTNLNEIQELTGRGKATTLKGKAVDKVLSTGEDIVSVMNFANRWQEHMVREGYFLGQLENLTKREWGIDLLPALQEGKLVDLLNNSLKPKGKRSFEELMEDSARLALDVTYAKQPDTTWGKAIASWFTHTGVGPVRATWLAEFPRFMINALELIGQGMGGASIPVYKKLSSVLRGGKAHLAFKKPIPEMPIMGIQLTTKDRQRIARNITGLGAFLAAYKAISSPDSPADVKMVRAPLKYKGEEVVIDVTAQFPLLQVNMVAKLAQQVERGTMLEFLSEAKNIKDIKNAFFGVSLRVGAGATLMDDLIDTIYNVIGDTDLSDLVATEKAAKNVGRAVGNWGNAWLNVFRQQRDFERWIGVRGTTYKDVSVPQDLAKPFWEQVGEQAQRPLLASGFGLTPEEEAKLPPRIGIGRRTKERILPGWKLIGGISFARRDPRDIEYLTDLNLSEWTVGSRSRDKDIRNFENGMINDILPRVTDAIRNREAKYREQYRNSAPLLKKEITMREFVQPRTRIFALEYLREHKAAIAEVAAGGKKKEGLTFFQATARFRKLRKDLRRQARTEFISRTGRYPVYASSNDLNKMVEYAKMLGVPESDSATQ